MLKRHEFYLITRGSGTIYINQKEFPIKEGCLIYIPPVEGLEYKIKPNKELLDYYSINFSVSIVNHVSENWIYSQELNYHYNSFSDNNDMEWSFESRNEAFNLPYTKQLRNYILVKNILSKIYKARNEIFPRDFWIENILMQQFLYEIARIHYLSEENETNVMRINKIISFINNYYTQNIELIDLCNEVKLSQCYLIKIFKKHTSYTPIQYVNIVRINHAKELLSETNASISDIALQVGYGDLYYFSKKFKKIIGVSPQKFRQLLEITS